MSVYMLTKPEQLEAAKELASYMERTCSKITIFTDCPFFYASVASASPGKLEYVLIDFRTYDYDLFSPYAYIAKLRNPVPVIIYNDPYPDPDCRAAFWYVKNKTYFPTLINKSNFMALISDFNLLQIYLQDKGLSRYFGAIATPEVFVPRAEREMKEALDKFSANHNFTKKLNMVFEYFRANEGKELKDEQICLDLWNEFNDRIKKNLQSYMSKIRSACEKEQGISIELIRKSRGIYRMSIKPVEED